MGIAARNHRCLPSQSTWAARSSNSVLTIMSLKYQDNASLPSWASTCHHLVVRSGSWETSLCGSTTVFSIMETSKCVSARLQRLLFQMLLRLALLFESRSECTPFEQ